MQAAAGRDILQDASAASRCIGWRGMCSQCDHLEISQHFRCSLNRTEAPSAGMYNAYGWPRGPQSSSPRVWPA
jgi:hypothetical protein